MSKQKNPYDMGGKGMEDRSGGFSTREQYAESLKAQAKTGKLSRKLRRAVKSVQRKKKKS